jgi:hypothetical protein
MKNKNTNSQPGNNQTPLRGNVNTTINYNNIKPPGNYEKRASKAKLQSPGSKALSPPPNAQKTVGVPGITQPF